MLIWFGQVWNSSCGSRNLLFGDEDGSLKGVSENLLASSCCWFLWLEALKWMLNNWELKRYTTMMVSIWNDWSHGGKLSRKLGSGKLSQSTLGVWDGGVISPFGFASSDRSTGEGYGSTIAGPRFAPHKPWPNKTANLRANLTLKCFCCKLHCIFFQNLPRRRIRTDQLGQ